MKKAVTGVILGAIAYFIWGALSWTIIPWHNAVVKPLPQELLITDTMKTVVKEPGFYSFPGMDPASTDPEAKAKWEEKFRRGPSGAVAFSPSGREPMAASTFVAQFINNLAIAALVMLVLAAARERYKSLVCRSLLSALLGLVAGLAAHVPHRLWFSFPTGFTVVNTLDIIIGFAILGAVMAKFVPHGADAR